MASSADEVMFSGLEKTDRPGDQDHPVTVSATFHDAARLLWLSWSSS
jgi:hypothetical protein